MKPWAKAQSIPMPENMDKRRRLTAQKRAELLDMLGKVSQRQAARVFGVSRRLVSFVWHPDRYERARRQFKERRKDGRYNVLKYETKEQWNARQRELKKRKYQLFKDK